MIDGPVLLAVPVPVPEPELVVFAVLLPVAVGAGAAVGNHQCGHKSQKGRERTAGGANVEAGAPGEHLGVVGGVDELNGEAGSDTERHIRHCEALAHDPPQPPFHSAM